MKTVKKLNKGIFIVIEGIDGAGKSTQIAMLNERLRESGYEVIITKEPTGESAFGKKIREGMYKGERFAPEEELKLFIEDRKEHLDDLVRPALDDGKIVVCDRYYYSNIAYQGAAGLDPEEIKRKNEAFAIIPDAVFYLRIDVDEGLHRVENVRNSTPTAFEKKDFLKKVSAIFDEMDFSYFYKIDASKSADEVSNEIMAVVKEIITKNE